MRTAMRNFTRHAWLRTRFVSSVISLFGFTAFSGFAPTQTSSSDNAAHFSYDSQTGLDLKQVSVTVLDGVTVQDITYTGGNGVSVPAYLVLPKGSGKFAGVIWGHWLMPGAADANRKEFLKEAISLAPAGIVSLLIDAPQARPNFKPTPNPVLVAQQVTDLRRGMDLLLSRPDVDATRIAYVGHSWDAGNGAILDAIDKRFSAFVFMSGPQCPRFRKYAFGHHLYEEALTATVRLGSSPGSIKWIAPNGMGSKMVWRSQAAKRIGRGILQADPGVGAIEAFEPSPVEPSPGEPSPGETRPDEPRPDDSRS
jgi:hypothetical protein